MTRRKPPPGWFDLIHPLPKTWDESKLPRLLSKRLAAAPQLQGRSTKRPRGTRTEKFILPWKVEPLNSVCFEWL